MKIINTTRLPEALGPYSHATVVNGMFILLVRFH